ncbi:hypothetical protein FRB99_004645 [Tulasnella sp. 403]|nr:hypothetical protein FRB99_004645 [Tulasnella sp. 403]
MSYVNSCKKFLDILAIAGPWLCMLGGISLDQFTVEPLTDYMFIGGKWDDEGTVQRVARVLFALDRGLRTLDDFYRALLGRDPQRLYPYIRTYKDSTGVTVEFKYLEPLGGKFGAKLVFLASIVERSETSDEKPAQLIVVKFTRRYCIKAHQLLASRGLAPQLRCDGTAECSPDKYAMIVIDYNPNAFSTGLKSIPDSVMSDVECAIKLLHAENIVFGDLRLPNVLAMKKEDETYSGMLVDFDWSGPAGQCVTMKTTNHRPLYRTARRDRIKETFNSAWNHKTVEKVEIWQHRFREVDDRMDKHVRRRARIER